MLNSTQIFFAAFAAVNLSVQIVAFVLLYKKWLRQGISRAPRIIKFELLVCLISFLSFFFFMIRLFPVWTDGSCQVFHGVVMFLYEFQLAVYTLIQYNRFVKILQLGYNFVEYAMCLLFIATTVTSTWGQTGYVMDGSCEFQHSLTVSVANALLHIIAELSIVFVFQFYYSKLLAILSASIDEVESLMVKMKYLLFFFVFWLTFISAANSANAMYFVNVLYNLHFTFILLIMGLPHFHRKSDSQSSSGHQSKISKSPSHVSKPTGNAFATVELSHGNEV
jgi:hypothetical protein